VLQALSATTFGFALTPGIHDPVTIPVSANGLVLTGQEISLPITASPVLTGLTVSSLTLGGMTLGSVPFIGTAGLLSQDNASLFWDNTNKRLGVGTAAPVNSIHIIKDGAQASIRFDAYRNTTPGQVQTAYLFYAARGTQAVPLAVTSDNITWAFFGQVYNSAAAWPNTTRVAGRTTEDQTGTAQGSAITFETIATGTTRLYEDLRITGGRIGVHTTAPDKALEINSATGACLRLTYNDTNGSAANYVDYAVTSGGDGTITPSGGDINVVGTLSAGDGGTTDYSKFEADGTLTFVGAATVFNDANVGSLVLQTGGTLPGIVEILDNDGDATGIYTRGFAVGEQGSGVIEVPHDYKEGTNLTFHVHWGSNTAPAGGTDNVQFRLIYSLPRDSNTFPDSVTVDKEVAYTTQYNWLRTDWTAINGATAGIGGAGVKIGDQFHFTLSRISASADEFGGEALVATIGFHYECDTAGSRTITAK
jgi:hypothetical protein